MSHFYFGSFIGEIIALSTGPYGMVKEIGLITKSGQLYNIESDINSIDLFDQVGEKVRIMGWLNKDMLVVAYFSVPVKKRSRNIFKPRRQSLARAN